MNKLFLVAMLLTLSTSSFAFMEFFEGECTYQCSEGAGSSSETSTAAANGSECFAIAEDVCGEDNFFVHYESDKIQKYEERKKRN